MTTWQMSLHDVFAGKPGGPANTTDEISNLPRLSIWDVNISSNSTVACDDFAEARFAVLAAEALAQPASLVNTQVPLATAIAQVAQVAQPPQGLALLYGPGDHVRSDGGDFAAGQFIGLRGVGLRPGQSADETAWEHLLQVGLPLWAFAPILVGEGDPFWAIMYGNFLTATDAVALPTGWREDRRGIQWQDGPEYNIFDRHGFQIGGGSGAGGWQDRGDEGLVRVRWHVPIDDGTTAYAWSQPRLIAPAGAGGGCG